MGGDNISILNSVFYVYVYFVICAFSPTEVHCNMQWYNFFCLWNHKFITGSVTLSKKNDKCQWLNCNLYPFLPLPYFLIPSFKRKGKLFCFIVHCFSIQLYVQFTYIKECGIFFISIIVQAHLTHNYKIVFYIGSYLMSSQVNQINRHSQEIHFHSFTIFTFLTSTQTLSY